MINRIGTYKKQMGLHEKQHRDTRKAETEEDFTKQGRMIPDNSNVVSDTRRQEK